MKVYILKKFLKLFLLNTGAGEGAVTKIWTIAGAGETGWNGAAPQPSARSDSFRFGSGSNFSLCDPEPDPNPIIPSFSKSFGSTKNSKSNLNCSTFQCYSL